MKRPVWRQVHWPTPLKIDRALALLEHLAAYRNRDPVYLRVISEGGRVRHEIGGSAEGLSDLDHLWPALIPEATLSPARGAAGWQVGLRVRIRDSGLGLRTDRLPTLSRGVLAALAAARRDESLMLQVAIGDGRPGKILGGRLHDPSQGLLSHAVFGARPASADAARRIQERAGQPQLHIAIRIVVDSSSAARSRELLRGVTAALRATTSPTTHLDLVGTSPDALLSPPDHRDRSLPAREVLAVAGWPLEDEQSPGLPSPHPKLLRPSGHGDSTRPFALATAPGEETSIGIDITSATYHTHILGPTGSGKSTVLLNLISADVRAGRAVVVLDAKTDLVSDALARIPQERVEDVVVLDPTQDSPVGLNPLSQPGRSPELIADSILTVIRDLFPTMFGPRTSDVLHAALLTLTAVPGATLTWLPRLLTEGTFRQSLIPQISDEFLLSFWQQFDAMTTAQQAQFVGPVLSRLRQFLLRPTLRRMLDQPEPRFNLADVFLDGKRPLLFVPLNSGLLGAEATRLLGSLLFGQLTGLTLARASLPNAQRTPISIYVDEAQEFVRLGGDLADVLARARSAGVALHLAHQHRVQFSTDVLAALDNNARNKIVFTLSPKDARDMAAMAGVLEPSDFMLLPRYHVYASTLLAGDPLGWVSGRTLPPPKVTSDPEKLIRGSARRYGNAMSAEAPLKDPSIATDPAVGRRKRRS